MVVALNPIAMKLGPYAVGWFGLLALVGLASGVAATLRDAGAMGLPREPLLDALAWAIPVSVLGGRLVHVLGAVDRYLVEPGGLPGISLTGLSLWGAIAAGGLVAASYLRARKLDAWLVADAAAPGLALGIAIGRLGELVQGVGQGTPTTAPWGTRYLDPLSGTPDFGVPRHPAQAYDGLIALGLFLVLAAQRRRPSRPGVRFCLFLMLYGAARIVLGQVRLDAPLVAGLQAEQLIALGAVLVAVRRLAKMAPWPWPRGPRPDVAAG